MGKRKSNLDDDITNALAHWGITDKAKEELAHSFAQDEEEPTESEPEETPQPEHERTRLSKFEGQNLRVKNRGSKSEGQKQPSRKSTNKTQETNRTFSSRPQNPERDSFVLLENIPKRHFFTYYNTLHDTVLPQVNRKSRLLLCVLFRRSHGFNRNWCQMNFREMERATGATSNTLRENLKYLIEDGWVCILSDGYHESTTYGLKIPVSIEDDQDEEIQSEEKPEMDTPDTLDLQNLRVKNRESKIEGQNLTLKNRPSKIDFRPADFDPQKLRSCTYSTCTAQNTVHLTPAPHRLYVNPCAEPTLQKQQPNGENQVKGNLALKYEQPENESLQEDKSRLTPQEENYIYSRTSQEQSEIFDAQDAWDQILGSKNRPAPAKLNFLLDEIRRLGYEYKSLDKWFRECLEKTKQKQPDDPVAWMVSALKGGRYP